MFASVRPRGVDKIDQIHHFDTSQLCCGVVHLKYKSEGKWEKLGDDLLFRMTGPVSVSQVITTMIIFSYLNFLTVIFLPILFSIAS